MLCSIFGESVFATVLFQEHEVVHDVLDFKTTKYLWKNSSVSAQINQYPVFFDSYIKTNGTAYHINGTGYHNNPTLPGASGSGVIINDRIAGVHVRSGAQLPSNITNTIYNRRIVLVENNIFELISMDEIEQASVQLNNVGSKAILADLIQGYINSVNQQRKEELIEYLEHGRKTNKDKDTNPEFLKAINRLNVETRFWTSWFLLKEMIN